MVALLKQKSKVITQHKPRKTYEIKNMFKRPKIDESLTQEQRDKAAKALGLSGPGKTAMRPKQEILSIDAIYKPEEKTGK